MSRYSFAIVTFVTLTAQAEASFTPRAGEDFQVNQTTAYFQYPRDVAGLPNGDFIVIWQGTTSPTQSELFARRIGADGVPVGNEFQINLTSTNTFWPAVSASAAGGFVSVWNGSGQPSGNDTDIVARRYDANDAPLGGEILVNSYTTGVQTRPDVLHLPSGDFVMVWVDAFNGFRVKGRHFDASGIAQGTEYELSGPTALDPSVATNGSGTLLASWLSSPADIVARSFAPDGTPAGPESVIADGPPASFRFGARSAALGNGEYLVVWMDDSDTLASFDVWARRVDELAQPVGTEFRVNTYTTGIQTDVYAAARPGGGAVVAFSSLDQADNFADVYVRVLDDTGAAEGAELLVNRRLAGQQRSPSVAAQGAGSFVVVWGDTYSYAYGSSADGHGAGVIAHMVCNDDDAACDICPGFDDTIDTDIDGLPDGCDPCNNTGAQSISGKTRLALRTRPFTDVPAKSNQLKMRAELSVAGGIGAIDPAADGLRLRVESAHGGEIVDAMLPPGAAAGPGSPGWSVNASGSTILYRDKSGAVAGITKVAIKDLSSKGPGLMSASIKARSGLYPAAPRYAPPRAILVFGDEAAGDAGQCAETMFDVSECDTQASQMICKR